MEIPFSKYYEHNSTCETNFPLTMDHDSGYISHNTESNSDSSLENLTEVIPNITCSKPIYLSEDALLEKPNINVNIVDLANLSMEIEKENYEETRKIFHSPDEVIPSSVVSQKTNYSEFENDSDSDKSVEIHPVRQIIIENVYHNDSVNNPHDISDINVDEMNTRMHMSMDSNNKVYNEESDYNSTLSTLNDGHGTDEDTSINSKQIFKKNLLTSASFCDNELVSHKNEENTDLLALHNINQCNTSNENENENKQKLTLIFSKCNKENIYSVKRKYRSLTPDKGDISENVTDLEKNITPKTMEIIQTVDIIEDKDNFNYDSFKEYGVNTQNILENNLAVGDKIVSIEQKESETENTLTFPKNDEIETSLEQKNESSLSMTPEKKYENSVDPNISPDLFGEEETIREERNEVSPRTYIAKEKYIIKNDYKILKNVQNGLKGVLPPLSVTVVQMSINEMLNRLESNKNYFWTSNCPVNSTTDTKNADNFNINSQSSIVGESSLLIKGSFKEIINKPWPKILENRFHGLHHNRSKLSEEFEDLCAKYGQRYVGAETQSTCTVFETNFVSPVKRKQLKPRWPVKSPGRRLSHLAKRRITFACSSLQAGSSSVANSRARQILVDARKLNLLNRSPKKSPRKTPRKSPRIKNRTPSSSAKKKLAMRFRALTGEIENTNGSSNNLLSSKRALFQSPDRDINSSLYRPSTSGTSNFNNDLKNPNTKRALFISPSKNSPIKKSPFKRSPFKRLELGIDKKRKRSDSRSENFHPSKMSRNINVDIRPTASEVKGKLNKSDINIPLNRSIGGQSGELSAIHKKKLQWAVYEALRSQNIAPSHAQFKIFASILARVTRRFLPNLTNNMPRPEGGTSERMLRIARYHVYAVVKGKSLDEIINEYVKSRSRNVKPQGYIGIAEFNEKNKAIASNKENVQGRVNTIESLEKKKLEQLGGGVGTEDKIQRIRKVINFGDDNS